MSYSAFKSFEELCDNISRGGEVEFVYKGKNYAIFNHNSNVYITEAYNQNSEKIYDNLEAMGEYVIDGKMVKDIIDEVVVTFRCF